MGSEKINIQWFPGHMTKTRRMIEADLKQVDAVIEIVDARLPLSSRNPIIDEVAGSKKRIIVLNKSDLSAPKANAEWEKYFRDKGFGVVLLDALSGRGVEKLPGVMRRVLREKIEHNASRGMNKPLRAMVLGIPNVGKSSLINRLAKAAKTKVADRPGVTRGKQWIKIDGNIDLLDTPGILWPKFEDEAVSLRLAFTGAVKDDVIDVESVACRLLEWLKENAPEAVSGRYGLSVTEDLSGHELLRELGKKRNFLISGGEIDMERAARILLDEFRGGKLGRITLESADGNEAF